MARLSLGAATTAPTVLPMDALGIVAVKLGFASLYLEEAEADALALELQTAAKQLRAAQQGAAA